MKARTSSIHIVVLIVFLVNIFGNTCPVSWGQVQKISVQGEGFILPAPGSMVHLSPRFDPPILKGLKVHPDNPLRFDFILNKAGTKDQVRLKNEASRLIKYFLASLTIPEQDLWVNLSPYEKQRIIPRSFGLTEMGRDLLAEDYMLKQITASLIAPEDKFGKEFWKRVYSQAVRKFGTTNIPVNTFNKVWIVPEKSVVYENTMAGTVYVIESKLKVMLEEDYLSIQKQNVETQRECASAKLSNREYFMASHHRDAINRVSTISNTSALCSQIIREVVIPELTREVNENENFARLRQVYNSLILAAWYKKKIKDSILAQVYENKNKVAGVGYRASVIVDSLNGAHHKINSFQKDENKVGDVERIYQQYLHGYSKY